MSIQDIKKKASGIVSKIESQAKKREGIPGGIADIVNGAGKIAKTVADKAISVHKDVQRKGGYMQVGADAINNISDKFEDAYQSFEKTFFTDGVFDEEKAREALNNTAEATKKYGSRAVQNLAKLAKKGVDSIKDNYRGLIPSEEERNSKYKGIGSACSGIFFREDFENCLGFYAKANEKIPSTLRTKDVILDDIKASASKDATDLIKFYSFAGDKTLLGVKKTVVQKYLK